MPPAVAAESRLRAAAEAAAAAKAKGKLAPQNKVAGRIAQMLRAMSIWKVKVGLFESCGLIGQ